MLRKPVKCGLQLNPPTFILIYALDGKMKKNLMPLRNFKSNSDVKFIAHELIKRHNLNDIPIVKIEKMLRLLQELLKGVDKNEAIMLIEKEFAVMVDQDLNKLPIHEIEQQKQLMEALFKKNQIKKDSEDFVYDKQINFDTIKEDSNWDD